MNTINHRKDVTVLVNKFYTKIRKDALLGPIFNGHISEEQWEYLYKIKYINKTEYTQGYA